MPGPFDRFNDRAKRVLALSQDEAIRFNHTYIGTEHLLLGLVREGEGVAARVLESFGIQLSQVRTSVEFMIGRGTSTTTPSEITLSPGVKRVIELASEEARALGHHQTGTEHLLLGILRHDEEKSPAKLVLTQLGVSFEAVRQRVIETLAGRGVPISGAHAPVVAETPGPKRDWYCEDVLSGKLAVKVLYEDDLVLGIEHPHPTYQIHGVVIPKKHVSSLLAPEALDPVLLASMLRGVQTVAKALGLDQQGFRMEANAAGPKVTPHMHWHVAGPGHPPQERGRSTAGAVGPAAAPRAGSTSGIISRFDDSAKRVIALAQEEAIRLNHNYIGTEHLLAGLMREGAGSAVRALEAMRVDLSKVRTALEFIIGRGETQTSPSDITMSPRTKKVLELAVDEAEKMGKPLASSGHILLGLIREGQGILQSLNVEFGVLRQKVVDAMKDEPPKS